MLLAFVQLEELARMSKICFFTKQKCLPFGSSMCVESTNIVFYRDTAHSVTNLITRELVLKLIQSLAT